MDDIHDAGLECDGDISCVVFVCLPVSGLRGSKFSAPGSGASVTNSGLWSLMLPAELAWTNLGVDRPEPSYEF